MSAFHVFVKLKIAAGLCFLALQVQAQLGPTSPTLEGADGTTYRSSTEYFGGPLFGQIVPPSPNAAAFGKVTDIPVSMYTGQPNVSIPLFVLKTQSLSVPITLSYHYTGLRVEERPSWVGLGWTLNAGGVVSRTIRGLADEAHDDNQLGYFLTAAAFSPGSSIDSNSLMHSPNSYLFTDSGRVNQDSDLFKYEVRCGAEESTAKKATIRRQAHALASGFWGGQPDLFNYSLPNGQSGKYLYQHDPSSGRFDIKLIPKNNVIIAGPFTPGTAFPMIYREDGVDIFTPDGVHYAFEEVEASRTTQLSVSTDGSASGHTTNFAYPTAWYLSRISDASGQEFITFHYEEDTLDYYGRTQHIQRTKLFDLGNNSSDNAGSEVLMARDLQSTTHYNYYSKRLRYIRSSNGYEVEFLPTTHTVNETGAKGLWQVIVRFEQRIIQRYLFDYKGGGQRLMLKELTQLTPDSSQSGNLPVHKFRYVNENSAHSLHYGAPMDYWGYWRGGTSNESQIPSVYSNIYDLGVTGRERTASEQFATTGALQMIEYPTGGTARFDWELHDFSNIEDFTVDYTQSEDESRPEYSIRTVSASYTYEEDNNDILPVPGSPINVYSDVMHIRPEFATYPVEITVGPWICCLTQNLGGTSDDPTGGCTSAPSLDRACEVFYVQTHRYNQQGNLEELPDPPHFQLPQTGTGSGESQYPSKILEAGKYKLLVRFTPPQEHADKLLGETLWVTARYVDGIDTVTIPGFETNTAVSLSEGGGIRVKRIELSSPGNLSPIIKTLEYTRRVDDGQSVISSGRLMSPLVFGSLEEQVFVHSNSSEAGVASAPCADGASARFLVARDQSLYAQRGSAQGSMVGYDSVHVYFGEYDPTGSVEPLKGTGGKITYAYKNKADESTGLGFSAHLGTSGASQWGATIGSGISHNLTNGKLLHEITYRREGNRYVKQAETRYWYNNSLYLTEKVGFALNVIHGTNFVFGQGACTDYDGTPKECGWQHIIAWETYEYTGRPTLYSTIREVYDDHGVARETRQQTFYRDSGPHIPERLPNGQNVDWSDSKMQLPKRQLTKGNDRDDLERVYVYPDEMGVASSLHGELVKRFQLGPVEERALRNDSILSARKTEFQYAMPDDNGRKKIVPSKVLIHEDSIATKAVNYVEKGAFERYDADGHLLQFRKEADIPTAVVWSATGDRALAQVQFAGANQIAYTSFEEPDDRSWSWDTSGGTTQLECLNHFFLCQEAIDDCLTACSIAQDQKVTEWMSRYGIASQELRGVVMASGDLAAIATLVDETLTVRERNYLINRGFIPSLEEYPHVADSCLSACPSGGDRMQALQNCQQTLDTCLLSIVPDAVVIDGQPKTGERYYQSTGDLTVSNLPTGEYVVSFWAKSIGGSTSVTVNGQTQSISGGDWQLFQIPVTLTSGTGSTITVSPGSADLALDELRLFPRGAKMSSFTYHPSGQVLTMNGPNNLIMYYEYDELNRLIRVRDHEGNLLQAHEYQYATE